MCYCCLISLNIIEMARSTLYVFLVLQALLKNQLLVQYETKICVKIHKVVGQCGRRYLQKN